MNKNDIIVYGKVYKHSYYHYYFLSHVYSYKYICCDTKNYIVKRVIHNYLMF